MDRRFHFGIIGLGRAGSIHFKNILMSKACLLKYALDIDEKKLKCFANEYQNYDVKYLLSNEYSTILDDPELDGIFIATPTNFHEQNILLALQKGKSVFCEKPISHDLQSIKRCYELAQNKNLVLHCSLNRRFDPSLQHLKQLMINEELGKIHLIKSCSRDSPKPSMDYLKISNGIFHDCGVHDLDIVCWLLKRKPTTAYSIAFTNDPEIVSINDSETVVITLTFDDGTLAVIDLSRQSTYGYDQRVEIHGDLGMIESLNQRPINVQYSNSNGILLSPLMYSFPSRYAESYCNSLNEFIQCLKEKKPSSVSVDDIVQLWKLTNACELSCKTRTVIQLD